MNTSSRVLIRAAMLTVLFVPSVIAATGPETARDLTDRYYSNPRDCGRSTQPSFLCAGVIFRATAPSPFYNSWDPSPASVKSGGTSFSYLREDSKYRKLVREENNGYILYPIQRLPKDKSTYQVLCSFPLDGGTNIRDDKGCGKSDRPGSQACDKQGIYNGYEWAKKYQTFDGTNNNTKECGFDVRDVLDDAAVRNFNASIDAMDKVGREAFEKQNELRLDTWNDSTPDASLPIQAFFYIPTQGGLDDARFDQQRYYQQTGVWVPVIKMTLPEQPSDEATFSFSNWDQAVESSGAVVDRYIQSAEWINRFDPGTGRDEWSLSIRLTDEGRKQNDSSGSDHVFAELFRKYGADARWVKPAGYDLQDNSMRRQLVCHFQIAKNKEPWNLEPFRPNASNQASKQAGCNML